jgi:type IV pilus assembly protein PilW
MRRKFSGFSLVELMVALALGLFVVAAMVYVFANSSKSYGELQKAAQQIENGRLAINLLAEDLRNSGQFGDFVTQPPLSGAPVTIPASVLGPCPSLANLLSDFRNSIPFAVQGYNDVASFPADLANCLSSSSVAGIVANSDIIVVRRGDTTVLIDPEGSQNGVVTTSATPLLNEVYIQTSLNNFAIQLGGGASIDKTKTADNQSATLLRKDFTTAPAGQAGGYIRKFHVHVYFVSQCADPDCSTSTRNIPTLKRAEVTSLGGANPVWRIVPLVEGIENLQMEYGVDIAPNTVSSSTGFYGDGAADSFVTSPPATLWDATGWTNVVAVRLFVLARNLDATVGYRDDKAYKLYRSVNAVTGANNIAAKNDSFKRHVFEMEIPLVNVVSRRLIPPTL